MNRCETGCEVEVEATYDEVWTDSWKNWFLDIFFLVCVLVLNFVWIMIIQK
jgi:hypothetical protein